MPEIVKKQTVSSLKPGNTAFEAATLMTTSNIGAIIVNDDDGNLSGIVTERDMTRRVVGKGLDPKTTLIEDFMTKNPDTLAPDDPTSAEVTSLAPQIDANVLHGRPPYLRLRARCQVRRHH